MHNYYNIFIVAVINGSLAVARHPTDDEELLEVWRRFEDNRTGIVLGSDVSMNCAANTSSDNALPIQILWIRDGKTIVGDSTHHIDTTNLTSILNITNFAHRDAGVYQCVFNADAELITTTPFRLQTGESNELRVSIKNIIIAKMILHEQILYRMV